MTEIAENILMPLPRAPRYCIDPVAFAIAFVGGPLFVALVGSPALFIPVAALIWGGPVYLALGLPLLLIYLQRHPCTPSRIAKLGLCAMLVLVPVICIAAIFQADAYVVFLALIFVVFGLIFAPLWGLTFGWIYRGLARDFYTRAYAL